MIRAAIYALVSARDDSQNADNQLARLRRFAAGHNWEITAECVDHEVASGSDRLNLNPPEHALVLCCDEKSQIQALDRTQPGLRRKRGRAGTMTHDYKRNGTATLFAALNTLDGNVIGLCQERHRHQEWIHFLRRVDDATPEHKPLPAR
jgi:hypothetical protein